jgi:hypothetical protein
MPVVQPYAISQPFATAGKDQPKLPIVPIHLYPRATGLHGLMKSTKFAALEPAISNRYKPSTGPAISDCAESAPFHRHPQDAKAFDDKFETNEIFRSASQIVK